MHFSPARLIKAFVQAAAVSGAVMATFGASTPNATVPANPTPASAVPSYQRTARPVLATYCFKCHGPTKQKGKVNFSLISDDRAALRKRKLWRKAIEQVESGDMPPEDEKQPAPAERQQLLQWMKAAAASIPDPADRDPGPSPVRRLTLAEYNNTIRDLLGVQIDAAGVGLTDESGNGNSFGNMAAALDIPPAVMEKYFAAADQALDCLFETELRSGADDSVRDRGRRAREAMFGVKPHSWAKPDAVIKPPDGMNERDAARSIAAPVLRRAYRAPVSTAEVDRFMAVYDRAASHGAGYVGSVRLMLKAILISPRFLYRIEQAPSPVAGARAVRLGDHDLATRLSYFLWSTMPDAALDELADRGKLADANPSRQPVKLGGEIIGSPDTNDTRYPKERVFDGDPYTWYDGPSVDGDWVGLDLQTPRKITQIRYMACPLYGFRRHLTGGVLQIANAADFSDAIEVLKIEKEPASDQMLSVDVAAPGTFRYVRFLSGKGFHAELAEMEVWGEPSAASTLEQQARRMLEDPRARALTDNFASHWLQIYRLASARPSTEFFPDFNPDVRAAAFQETAGFFDHLRIEDRSLLDLLDADYTWLNEDLANYYKIPNVKGKELRRVPLKPEYHRGGLLGMSSMLALTSATARTSPTLRGKYVLDVLLGAPPPPPPANAGVFKDSQDKAKEPKSFRERMAQHAANPECAACHKKMDPLGYALENYNAVGQWRDSDQGRPLDAHGELPTGEKMNGVSDLKQVLLRRKQEFVRNLVEQMMVYALGRDLDENDDDTVEQIQSRLEGGGYKFSELVLGIVESYPFQYCRSAPADAVSQLQKENHP